MSGSKDERERLRRIKEQQIYTRDPRRQIRRTQSEIASRYKSKKQEERFFREAYKSVPYKWKGLVTGGLIGLAAFIVLPAFVEANLATIIGVIAIVLLGLLGVVIGTSLDWREDMRDYMKK